MARTTLFAFSAGCHHWSLSDKSGFLFSSAFWGDRSEVHFTGCCHRVSRLCLMSVLKGQVFNIADDVGNSSAHGLYILTGRILQRLCLEGLNLCGVSLILATLRFLLKAGELHVDELLRRCCKTDLSAFARLWHTLRGLLEEVDGDTFLVCTQIILVGSNEEKLVRIFVLT